MFGPVLYKYKKDFVFLVKEYFILYAVGYHCRHLNRKHKVRNPFCEVHQAND